MRTLWIALLCSLGAVAQADTIISTALLSVNPDSTEFPSLANCSVANVSTKPVTINSVRFLDETGNEIAQVYFPPKCSYPDEVFPGLACIHALSKFDLPQTGFIRCEVNVGKGNSKSLRVMMELINPYEITPSDRPATVRSDVGR